MLVYTSFNIFCLPIKRNKKDICFVTLLIISLFFFVSLITHLREKSNFDERIEIASIGAFILLFSISEKVLAFKLKILAKSPFFTCLFLDIMIFTKSINLWFTCSFISI